MPAAVAIFSQASLCPQQAGARCGRQSRVLEPAVPAASRRVPTEVTGQGARLIRRITARILAHERYHFDALSDLIPEDVAFLVRSDTGAGSCEVLWVSDVTVDEAPAG
jgi:hypothetical protein